MESYKKAEIANTWSLTGALAAGTSSLSRARLQDTWTADGVRQGRPSDAFVHSPGCTRVPSGFPFRGIFYDVCLQAQIDICTQISLQREMMEKRIFE